MAHDNRYLRRECPDPFVIEIVFNRNRFFGTWMSNFNILASHKVVCKENNENIKPWWCILLPIQWETLINLVLLIWMLNKALLLRMACFTNHSCVSIMSIAICSLKIGLVKKQKKITFNYYISNFRLQLHCPWFWRSVTDLSTMFLSYCYSATLPTKPIGKITISNFSTRREI